MQDSKRTLWYLKKIPLLANLGPEAMARLAERVSLREIRRRDVIYLPGDPGEALYFVNGGRVKISKVTRDGKALTLSYCGPSEIFGECCLVTGGPREEMAEAMENAMITEVERDDFENMLRQHPLLGYQMTRLLAKRRLDLENKLETLVFRDVTSKLAELLLQLADEYGVEDARGTLVALKITHQELANLIGSTRETVSLTLSQFKRQNLICTEGRKVIIADTESLRALF
ncbi:Crp/Fnr family transcriptional regulator [Haliangium sp.]|uniref:Crp/Fnr family transcriptional regulator n=1 Tax=Haliangium sp. TaxID=2663208 RepID=UPI003D14992C